MVTIKNISSGISACIVSLTEIAGQLASLQGTVELYKNQLNLDLARNLIMANALYYEVNAPTQDLYLSVEVPFESIQSFEYIGRLKNAFTDSGFVVVIYYKQ